MIFFSPSQKRNRKFLWVEAHKKCEAVQAKNWSGSTSFWLSESEKFAIENMGAKNRKHLSLIEEALSTSVAFAATYHLQDESYARNPFKW